ncbi:helix-turn-helix transcriptional regulator [Fusobacterium sp.]|uniref:helix-turn-helix domain-containing protein n=1 Tax=Fusobacterium sp. TaxID=68766 RepID=UPI00262FC6C4|nr:helix-turn-helix transcriptional regulator [Fusobacterium sp.]
MNFGEVLKEIRLKNNYSLRGLADKLGISFSYLNKIERGETPINKNVFEKIISFFPFEKEIFIKSYINEFLPTNLSLNNIIDSEYIYFKFLKSLDLEDRKNIYYSILEKVELSSLKNGSYENKKEEIEKAKISISELK